MKDQTMSFLGCFLTDLSLSQATEPFLSVTLRKERREY